MSKIRPCGCKIVDSNLHGTDLQSGASRSARWLELSLFVVGNPTSLEVSILDMTGGVHVSHPFSGLFRYRQCGWPES